MIDKEAYCGRQKRESEKKLWERLTENLFELILDIRAYRFK